MLSIFNLVHVQGWLFYPKCVLNFSKPHSPSLQAANDPSPDRPLSNTAAAGDGTAKREALSVITQLRKAILALKTAHMTDIGDRVDYLSIASSAEFQTYLEVAQKLRTIDLGALSEIERRAFFINVYNSLIVHAIIYGYVRKSFFVPSVARKLLYVTASYNIGGYVYSLDEIEHGMLRDNASGIIPLEDPRLVFKVGKDPRLHFALNCGAISCPPIAVYKAESLDRELDVSTRNYLRSIELGGADGRTIILSKIMLWYKSDFAQSDRELIAWICEHSDPDTAQQIRAASLGRSSSDERDDTKSAEIFDLNIEYQEYKWDLNAL
jgi:hypothetical protein